MFYNTTNLNGNELLCSQIKAISLEKRVYELFKEKQIPMSWTECYNLLPNENEVSLKRSLTCLADKFKLKKDLNDKTVSKYGKQCYRYKLIN